eukprot:TRINITY_DN2000_c0_g1_i1.p1 TRINITY_DN2000_c0_g1~~TRINITY_DN2000_c0_g1_i1.p1  ORF type:complete len:289 (+),score=37.71 TRINITY_DN2000_c0_g1_i1:82-948(+)
MGNTHEKVEKEKCIEVSPGFYTVRAGFKILSGLIDIGTHMSLIKLSNGRFLVIDTVPLTPSLKQQIDELTENGSLVDGVIASHPFHTLAFPGFYEAYPKLQYYGTPRHLRKVTQIPWAGSLDDEEVRNKWSPEVEMRIPDGAEFVSPEPESYNHFNCVWIFGRSSRTLHVDDTLNYFSNPGTILQLVGKTHGTMEFHPSFGGPALLPTPEAPGLFKSWLEKLLDDWDFDNICCAHTGFKLGGAKELVRKTLAEAEGELETIRKNNEKKIKSEKGSECEKYNVNGHECG